MKFTRLSLLLAASIGLSACQLTTQKHSAIPELSNISITPEISDVIAQQVDIMTVSDSLYQKNQFDVAANQLLLAAQAQDINQVNALLYFFRGFSFYGDSDLLDESSVMRLDLALTAISALPALMNDLRLQEQYAVTVMRFYGKKKFSGLYSPHLSKLLDIITNFDVKAVETTQATFALWESFRAIGILNYYATRYNDETLQNLFKRSNVNKVMLDFVTQHATEATPIWVNQNALWVIANNWRIENATFTPEGSDTDAMNNATLAIDKAIVDTINNLDLSKDHKQQLFTYGYLTSTYRGQSECEESFATLCHTPKLDTVLPINHVCSKSLFIRAQSLSKAQLEASCQRLTSQEDRFHQLFATNKQPVANDLNTSLRVVIFDEWSQYHSYSPILFDINTDNGGMYIEGTPADPENQATFFAFKATWLEPEFKVWNLNHEYVHYLTGRFTTYGPFGHYDDSLVWWSEGVAELIAKDRINPKVYKLNQDTKAEDRPSLSAIFATTYQDGSERVYSWSYLAARYLADNAPDALVRLKDFLKADFFDGYKKELADIANKHQAGFIAWLAQQATDYKPEQSHKSTSDLPHKINRYAYPKLLTPSLAKSQAQHRRY